MASANHRAELAHLYLAQHVSLLQREAVHLLLKHVIVLLQLDVLQAAAAAATYAEHQISDSNIQYIFGLLVTPSSPAWMVLHCMVFDHITEHAGVSTNTTFLACILHTTCGLRANQ
jgi:hypothetical protein